MPRLVSYRIHDRDDGLFDAVATLAPDKTYRREGFASLAEVEDWIDGLRILMAAIGAPLVRAQHATNLDEAAALRPDGDAPEADSHSARARLLRFRDAVSGADDATD
ncbi:hypothetical protein [Methylobacterium sp. J-092]|uniref:hypothetical protein n=1 Tax=Methylobacterium sp. J-092 TaxID=2836667 RepID=UPI001FBA62F4|nr:hypothetical protein [Methylobacterium sp. J-092]MCJ2010216.1 hypothetical protein [Methylobacterium sp. J-092]